jgi:hypothetical protein
MVGRNWKRAYGRFMPSPACHAIFVKWGTPLVLGTAFDPLLSVRLPFEFTGLRGFSRRPVE